jgi:hypothetical protein
MYTSPVLKYFTSFKNARGTTTDQINLFEFKTTESIGRTTFSHNLRNNKIPLLLSSSPKQGFRDEYTMVATGFSTRIVNNPYAHPTALAVARAMASPDSYINSNRLPQNMACRSQLRNGSIKHCKRRGGRSKFRYGSHKDRIVDGSRSFSQYRDCKICKVKQYNASKYESQKKKMPHRGHHPLCP